MLTLRKKRDRFVIYIIITVVGSILIPIIGMFFEKSYLYQPNVNNNYSKFLNVQSNRGLVNNAEGDIIINGPNEVDNDDFIELLNHRAENVMNVLNDEEEKMDFQVLHDKKITAIEDNNHILSHEILKEMYQLPSGDDIRYLYYKTDDPDIIERMKKRK